MSDESVCSSTSFSLAWRVDLFLTLVAAVACWSGTAGLVAFVDFGIRIAKLDSDVSLEFVLEAHSLHT